ncbi:hypothetical protein K440DRAFT_627424, partial [Wilcoxina mikolae CBS 423.85]
MNFTHYHYHGENTATPRHPPTAQPLHHLSLPIQTPSLHRSIFCMLLLGRSFPSVLPSSNWS